MLFQMNYADINGYFVRFGEVKSISILVKGDNCYGLVEFKTVEAAASALSNKIHCILSCDVEVKAAEPWRQPDHILNALHDDCLKEVFKHLNQQDLFNAADVCIRFNQHAKAAYAVNYKEVEMIFSFIDIEAMVRKFGQEISSLSVVSVGWASNNKRLLQTIIEHVSSKLEELKLSYISTDGNVAVNSTLTNLKYLELVDFHMENLRELLEACPQLKVIKMKHCQWNGRCFPIIKHLEEIQLIRNPSINDSQFVLFVVMNSSLKKLVLEHNHELNSVIIFGIIGRLFSNLVDLEIDQPFRDNCRFDLMVQNLGRLSSLKALKLNFNSMSVATLMRALAIKQVQIEQLKIINGDIDTDAINSMAQLNQMKTLELDDINGLIDEHVIALAKSLIKLQDLALNGSTANGISVSTLKKIVSHAPKLSSLTLNAASSLSIDLDDYNIILKAIQNRPDNVPLMVRVTSAGKVINVPENILRMNREWLSFAMLPVPRK